MNEESMEYKNEDVELVTDHDSDNDDEELKDPAFDEEALEKGRQARLARSEVEKEELKEIKKREDEKMNKTICMEMEKEGEVECNVPTKQRDLTMEQRLQLKVSNQGRTITRRGGGIVLGGSRHITDQLMQKYGWSGLDDMRKEAIAHKEFYMKIK